MSKDNQACEVPLLELLRRVPPKVRYIVAEPGGGTRSIPVGELCRRAAEMIERLRKGNCPHIVSSGEGTSYCSLNGPNLSELRVSLLAASSLLKEVSGTLGEASDKFLEAANSVEE